MSDNVIQFPPDRASARLSKLEGLEPGINTEASELGTPDEWAWSAIMHLKAASSRAPEGVIVSKAALHLALGYIEQLQAQLGLIPPASAS